MAPLESHTPRRGPRPRSSLRTCPVLRGPLAYLLMPKQRSVVPTISSDALSVVSRFLSLPCGLKNLPYELLSPLFGICVSLQENLAAFYRHGVENPWLGLKSGLWNVGPMHRKPVSDGVLTLSSRLRPTKARTTDRDGMTMLHVVLLVRNPVSRALPSLQLLTAIPTLALPLNPVSKLIGQQLA